MKNKVKKSKGRLAGALNVTNQEREAIQAKYNKAMRETVSNLVMETGRSRSSIRRIVFGTAG